jgi:hypothetical protein
VSKATLYSLSSTLTGGITGALLGAIGSSLSRDLRFASASVLGILAIVLGSLELGTGRLAPLQCDRETPQRWMHTGAWRWALRNGVTLGFGATSRIGFWLWYVVPISALLVGRPVIGGMLYGLYGLVRGGFVWVLIPGLARYRVGGPPSVWLLELNLAARVIAAGQLILVGIAVVLSVGF